MSTVLADTQSFRMERCSACGLELYNNGQSCSFCSSVFCASCHSLKAKLDLSFQNMTSMSASSGFCPSCEKIMNIKNGSQHVPTLSKGDNAMPATADRITVMDSDKMKTIQTQNKAEKQALTKRTYSGQSTRSGQSQDNGQSVRFGQNQDTSLSVRFGQSQDTGQSVRFRQSQDNGQSVRFGQSQDTSLSVRFGQNQDTSLSVRFGQSQDSGQSVSFRQSQDSGQYKGFGQGQETNNHHGHCPHLHCHHHRNHRKCSDCGQVHIEHHHCDTHQSNSSVNDFLKDSKLEYKMDDLYDDIPYALLICNVVTYKEIEAKKTKQQIKLLQSHLAVLEDNQPDSDTTKSNKNATGDDKTLPLQDTFSPGKIDAKTNTNVPSNVTDNAIRSAESVEYPKEQVSPKEGNSREQKSSENGYIQKLKHSEEKMKPDQKYPVEGYTREQQSSVEGNVIAQKRSVKGNANAQKRHELGNISTLDRPVKGNTNKPMEGYATAPNMPLERNISVPMRSEEGNANTQKLDEKRHGERNTIAQKRHEDEYSTQSKWPFEGNATEDKSIAEECALEQKNIAEENATPLESSIPGHAETQKSTAVINKSRQQNSEIEKKVTQVNHTVVENTTQKKFVMEGNPTQNFVVRENPAKSNFLEGNILKHKKSTEGKGTAKTPPLSEKAKHQRNSVDNNTPTQAAAEREKNMFLIQHFVHEDDRPQSAEFSITITFSQEESNSIPAIPNSVTEISSKCQSSIEDLKANSKTTEASRIQAIIHDLEELERVEYVDDGHSTPYATSIIESSSGAEQCPLLLIFSQYSKPYKNKPKSNTISKHNPSDGETSIYTEGVRKLEDVNKDSFNFNKNKNNLPTSLVTDGHTSTAATSQSTGSATNSRARFIAVLAQAMDTTTRPTAAKTQSAAETDGYTAAKADSTAAVSPPTAVTSQVMSSPSSASLHRLPKNQTPMSTILNSQPSSSAIQSTREKSALLNIPHTPSAKNQTVSQPTSSPVLKLRNSNRPSILAEHFHEGFKRLKQKQSEGKPKCNSCGRSECTGENVQSMSRMIKCARENGFQLQDVPPDGNCMFAAVVDQLLMYGDERFTARSLRDAAVLWLVDNPYTESGTPRSEFLSEDWHHYIDRMGKDGEWGDHIVLGAVAEVVGCTLRVMSPTEGAPHWTTLEPQGEGSFTSEKHLILGHVGEFHYTSLRPSDIKTDDAWTESAFQDLESPTTEIQGQRSSERSAEQIEADRLVDLFNNNHLDEQSDFPVAHFSYLLKSIIPMDCLDQAAIYSSQYTVPDLDEYGTPNPTMTDTDKLTGPVAEGVYVPVIDKYVTASSQPKLALHYHLLINNRIRVMSPDSPGYENCDLMLDEVGVCVGNTRLKRRLSNTYFPSPDLFVTGEQQIDKSPVYSKMFTMLIKSVPCLEYQSWPRVADSWITRNRYEGWPGEEFIQSVKAEGCLLIPYPHQASTYAEYEWQFYFGLIEKRMFQEIVSRHQKHGYIMFKTLCRQSLVEYDKVQDILKSIFFFACERVPSEMWEHTPGSCVLHMLDELVKGLGERHVPHYFIPQRNMIVHLSDRELQEMKEQVRMLRSQPLLFLRQVQETAMFKMKGDEIIDNISADAENFKQHRSVGKSVLDAFIPASISAAQDLIKRKYFKEGYDALSKVYEERLAVATCKDSLSYQMFLNGALSGLDMKSTVWLCAYADKILDGQLSKCLIRELCSELSLGKIGDFLPADVAGAYSKTEVPLEFFQVVGKFCVDFAKFLIYIEKVASALPVMLHAFEQYKINLEQEFENMHSVDKAQSKSANEDDYMLEVAVGLCHICSRQGKVEFFRGKFPDIKFILEKINTTEADFALWWLCASMKMDRLQLSMEDKIGVDQFSVVQFYINKWNSWPYEKKDYVF